MEGCNCIKPFWPTNELLIKYQYISDLFIALAYFSIPLELIYFANKSPSFPYRWVLIQFSAFIVLCGATHFINLWTFTMHTETVAFIMTMAKVATAVVSCATALMLIRIIPVLLSVKTRELYLTKKANKLDGEMGLIRTQVETGRHVRMLTHDVLDLSKLEDDNFKPDISAFNLHDVFKEVMSFVKPIAAIKKLSVSAILSPDLPLFAIGDEKRLLQIIINVCANAVKFTKEGHILLLASVVKSDSLGEFRSTDFHPVATDGHFYVKVQVKDTGCGINPHDLPHVFTKFAHTQNDENQGHTNNGFGIGLGLAICKRFVNLMDGHIWLGSDGAGKGCTVTFMVKLGVCDAY